MIDITVVLAAVDDDGGYTIRFENRENSVFVKLTRVVTVKRHSDEAFRLTSCAHI